MKEQLPVIIGILVASVIFIILWRKGAFLRISNYFRETQEELKKCSWPSVEELKGSTVVVIVAIALLGGFTFVVDRLVLIFLGAVI